MSVPWSKRTHACLALAAVAMVLFVGMANAKTVVTNHVVSLTRHDQANVPVTFGQIFRKDDVAKGESLTATLNGHPVPLQVDAKATNPDGSLRHAVLTVLLPRLAARASEPLSISAASPSDSRTSVTLAQLLATQYDATASLDIGGATYKADARELLAAADKADACKPWGRVCNTWLSGPLVTEWIVVGVLASPTGSTDPNLTVYFDVRAYAGPQPGSIAYVRTDIVVENASAYGPQAQPEYTATLTSGNAHYTSPALAQYDHTRWHQVLWWNDNQPDVYLRQDTRYIQDSLAVSRYEALQPGRAFLAKVRQACPPLAHCDQTLRMGDTGAQQAIGPLPRWTSVYIVDPDVRAYNWMLANTDALGAYSIHYRDGATGWPISIHRHPYVSVINWPAAHKIAQGNGAKAAKYRADTLAACCKTNNPNMWDNAHQPAEGYVAYMVTGSYYYMEEVAFGASHNAIWPNEAYRGYSKGLIDASHSQPRGKAWVLREMANAAYLLPDDYPMKAEFNDDVNDAIADFNTHYTDNPHSSPLGVVNGGVVYPMHGHKNVGMPPWQHSFVTWSAGHAAELGFAGAAKFRDWLEKFEIGLMTDWQNDPKHGYCWLMASAYKVQVISSETGKRLPDYTAAYAATFPALVGLECNSSEMVKAVGELEKQPWQKGEMHGYPGSPTGYPANSQVGLATAVDSGLPAAAAAWKIFESRSVKPKYNNYPNFAVIPRSPSEPAAH